MEKSSWSSVPDVACQRRPNKLSGSVGAFPKRPFRRVPDCAIRLTMSLGVVAATAEVRQPGDLLRMADDALYAAKHSGRDRVEVNSPVCK